MATSDDVGDRSGGGFMMKSIAVTALGADPQTDPELEEWVTKSDVVSYWRCPYAYSLVYKGEVSVADAMGESLLALMGLGEAFHDEVNRSVPVLDPEDYPTLGDAFADNIVMFHTPMYELPELMLRGIPDGIDPADGLFVPIEFKSHATVQVSDQIELAFYWLLLEPLRTRQDTPRGQMVLRRAGQPVLVDVALSVDRLDQVRALIDQVRLARFVTPEPKICGCRVCSVVRRDEVLAAAAAAKDLSMIHGLGPRTADALRGAGLSSYDELCDRSPEEVHELLRSLGVKNSSPTTVEQWQQHVRAFHEGRAVFFADEPPVGDSYIALDAEYLCGLPGDHLWLVGFTIVRGGTPSTHQLWASLEPESETELVEELARQLAENDDLPVVTWAGKSADLPAIRKAAVRAGCTDPFLERLHVDLYDYAKRSVRLPIPTLDLKTLAAYYGAQGLGRVSGGLEAQVGYLEWLRCSATKRGSKLKSDLIRYNQSDLDALVAVTEQFRALALDVPTLASDAASYSCPRAGPPSWGQS